LDKLLTHPDLKEGRVKNFVEEYGVESDLVIKTNKSNIEAKLKENYEQQKKLFDSFKHNLLAQEVYANEATLLRKGEQDLKVQLNKFNIELMQKERSDEYQRTLKRLLDDFSKTRGCIDSITKKELLQFVFKDILIKDKVVVKISFYQPFARYWKELKCNTRQLTTRSLENTYILRPLDDRWEYYLMAFMGFLHKIYTGE